MNWIDKAVAYVSPEAGARRIAARRRMEGLAAARALYQGANVSHRTDSWRAVSTDANSEIRTAGSRLRNVAHDLVRNNAYASRAVTVIAHNVVGSGIIPKVAAGSAGRTKAVQALLKRHFDTTDIDADGLTNLYGLQELAVRTVVESGSVLIRRRIRRPSDGLAVPLQLQILEPDYIDKTVNGDIGAGQFAVDGIVYNGVGKRLGYYLYNQHPGAVYAGRSSMKSAFVSADFVAHVYRVDRPGQQTGVTWFAPVILRMRDFADYTDAQLMRQKIAACFAAFITKDEDPVTENGQTVIGNKLELIEPGIIEHLRQGESVTFGNPPTTNEFEPYTKVTMHEIAAGLNVPYEDLTSDLSQVSFISGRLGRISFRQSIDAWRWNMLIPQMMGPIEKWTQDAVNAVTGSTAPFSLTWTPPKYEMVDPSSEVGAIRDAIRCGLTSRSEERRKQGYDSVPIDEEIAEDNKRADGLGLVFDSDARHTTKAGVAQKEPSDKPARTGV
jgi:lambda family phage portal protein